MDRIAYQVWHVLLEILWMMEQLIKWKEPKPVGPPEASVETSPEASGSNLVCLLLGLVNSARSLPRVSVRSHLSHLGSEGSHFLEETR